MGKGDKKSKRGKIVLGTYGARRHKKEMKKMMPSAHPIDVEKSEAETELKIETPKKKIKTANSH